MFFKYQLVYDTSISLLIPLNKYFLTMVMNKNFFVSNYKAILLVGTVLKISKIILFTQLFCSKITVCSTQFSCG